MSDENTEQQIDPAAELEMLKSRAKLLGVEHSNNISADTLRQKIAAKRAEMEKNEAPDEDKVEDEQDDQTDTDAPEDASDFSGYADVSDVSEPEPVAFTPPPQSAVVQQKAAQAEYVPPMQPPRPKNKAEIRKDILAENMRLIRVRITNLDPKKKDLHGEIITVANGFIGTVRRFIPFGEVTDDGWHIPYVIYKLLEKRRFLHIRTVQNKKTGTTSVKQSWAKEFAIEVLPPLKADELERLKQAQMAAGSLDSENDI